MTLYLKLMHGRDDPGQQMADWGFDGPVLGPFEAVHFTYLTHVRCFPEGNAGDELELCFHDDMLVYEGKYYGDFEIVSGDDAASSPILPPDPEGMNEARAEWAASCLRHFQCQTGTDWDDVPADLLCDLMHFCDREGFDFRAELDRARRHYEAETTEDAAAAEATP